MPAKSLHKVQKHIHKKKGRTAALHPQSRDRLRLERAAQRAEKIDKLHQQSTAPYQTYLQRLAFMQEAVQPIDVKTLSVQEMQGLVQDYIGTIQEEIDELEANRRPGRPPHPQRDKLIQKRDAERNESESGYWLPDLRDESTLKDIRDWDQVWGSLGRMKWIRISSGGTVRESMFPPKGNS